MSAGDGKQDPLDAQLSRLPLEVAPPDELWSRISAGITAPVSLDVARARKSLRQPASSPRWLQIAAGVLLVVASSYTTWLVMQRSFDDRVLQAQQTTVQQMQPVLNAMPVSFGGHGALDVGYTQARAALSAEFEQRVALLPPVARAKLQRDLADLRRAASEISATLGEHPSDPLLQQLLLSTYQSELALLGSVNDLTEPAMGADL